MMKFKQQNGVGIERRTILHLGLLAATLLLILADCPQAALAEQKAGKSARLNVLLITADDMNYDSLGVTGCSIKGISPNLDRLAAQGMLFSRAHVTIAVCQPCREVLMTGRYPHRNGGMGFQPIRRSTPTLGESLRAAGYFNGIMAKVGHLAPQDKYCWDVVVQANQLGVGRNPDLYYKRAKAFLNRAKQEQRPFFLMANTQDPHRPFAGSDQEKGRRARNQKAAQKQNSKKKGNKEQNAKKRAVGSRYPQATRYYKPDEVETPGFLPDLPTVRLEMSEYYTSVHRADESVGAVLRALEESGLADQTVVMFLSDHGMPLPFAKTNCYRHSTRTPWIVRWPGKVKAGSTEDKHFISGIDFMPTILDLLDLKGPVGMDGRSFAPLLKGEQQKGRERVFTHFHRTAGKRDYPMRSVIEGRYGYIFNAWSDGQKAFRNESQSGRTFAAMRKAAKGDEKIAQRVKLFEYRTPEELYDYQNDPDALHNLVDEPGYQEQAYKLRGELLKHLHSTNDPILGEFEKQVHQSPR